MKDWLGEQTDQFRAAIKLVVIDPSAVYAPGTRAVRPGLLIAVDKWNLVDLANQMPTEVRQRVTRCSRADHLTAKQWIDSTPLWTPVTRPTRSAPPGR